MFKAEGFVFKFKVQGLGSDICRVSAFKVKRVGLEA